MIVAAKKLTATMGLRSFVAVAIIFANSLNVIFADDLFKHYVNEWAATIPGGMETAREIVSSYGYTLVDQVCIFCVFLCLYVTYKNILFFFILVVCKTSKFCL